MRKRLPDFRDSSSPNNWYDLREDWALIEASLAKQYGIRIRQHGDMPWDEFSSLLAGLMPDTPLGSIVTIRSEQDPKVRKGWTADQRRIYNDWRRRQADAKLSDPETLEKQQMSLEAAMARMFGGERVGE
ncbi:hypothetical protein KIH86_13850 [Paenibacillus sp. HN-1]|uniref:Gp15 family bacteriophage protein n=1 Tax=Paenibacillus TaxID=44249 RepID=UPI001CA9654A|nr:MULTISPECIES: Gp15 family bacteriophage protein [Paenibacillus]MBY9082385.1 hypothetical protein [Paenibacillus sp. CGMCC 1.18879]MBY9085311.1 hypothetical protein [Paenibacillus sinensis]